MTKRSNIIKFVISGLLVMAGLLFFSANVHAEATINKTITTLMVGEKVSLKITGTTKKIKWKSSNAKVAKVYSTGKVKGLKKGTATITATYGKKSLKCKITVNNTMSVSNSEITISEPTTIKVRLTTSDGKIYGKAGKKSVLDVKFDSGWDGDYLPVKLVPKKNGDLKVTFSNSSNSEIAVVKVHVKNIKPEVTFSDIKVTDGAKKFYVGESTVEMGFTATQPIGDATLNIFDNENNVVKTITCGAIAKGTEKVVVWDGKKDDETSCNGWYTYCVVGGAYTYNAPSAIEVVSGSPFGVGDGSKTNPYRVSNIAEFDKIIEYNGDNFVLDSDIDFKNNKFDTYRYASTMFSSDKPFVGTLDGKLANKQYVITNIEGKNSLFGHIGEAGVLKNLVFKSCRVSAQNDSSLIAAVNKGTISNVYVEGSLLGSLQGALLVDNNYGVIENSVAKGQVRLNYTAVSSNAAIVHAGGMVVSNAGRIIGCTSETDINVNMFLDGKDVSGNEYYTPSTLFYEYLGGIASENVSGGSISQCTNKGQINGTFKIPSNYKTEDKTLLVDAKDSAIILVNNLLRARGYIAGVNSGMIVKPVNDCKEKYDAVDQSYNIGIIEE